MVSDVSSDLCQALVLNGTVTAVCQGPEGVFYKLSLVQGIDPTLLAPLPVLDTRTRAALASPRDPGACPSTATPAVRVSLGHLTLLILLALDPCLLLSLLLGGGEAGIP